MRSGRCRRKIRRIRHTRGRQLSRTMSRMKEYGTEDEDEVTT